LRLFLPLLFLSFYPLQAQQRADTTVVKNMLSEAYVYDNSLDTYLPVVDLEELDEKSIHINFNKDKHGNYLLSLKAQSNISAFIDNKMIASLSNSEQRFYETDKLFDQYGSNFKLTIYSEGLSARSFDLLLLTEDLPETKFLEDEEVVLVSQRDRDEAFQNFIIVALIVLGIYLSTINNFYPKVTAEFFKLSRALSVREIDENLLKSRPFTRINLTFYLFFSLLTSYTLIILFHLGEMGYTQGLQSTGGFIWFWINISGLIMLWLFGKYLLVSYFTSLFNIKSFLPSHYFNYVRIGLIVFLLSVVALIISYFGIEVSSPTYYQAIFNLVLIAIIIRSIVVMLKLMNSASYKFLHLFSYLCGTEFIPLGIIFFLGLNQHF